MVINMISIRLPSEIEERLNNLAKKTGRTKTFYVKEAVVNHLEDLEDIYDALERLSKPEKLWTLQEISRSINVAD